MLGEWAVHADRWGADAIGLMVRRERIQLAETMERSRAIYSPLGATFSENVWRFKNGARLRFAHLDRDADAESYQGHSYSRVYVEEITNFPSPSPIMKLMATLRSANGAHVGFRATGNPGGPGHLWVKQRYIDPAPLGWKVIVTEYRNPFNGQIATRDRVFIPGRITDHSLLGPEYVAQLQMSGSPELVRAWLEGDWSVVLGAFFPEFAMSKHVIEPRPLPAHWARFRAMDWGSAKPFCVGWYAVSDGELASIPRGTLIRYREWYGSTGEPNVGLKMTAEQVGAKLVELEKGDPKMTYGVIDPAAFASDGGPSIAERITDGMRGAMSAKERAERLVSFHPADNKRVAAVGHMGGWDQVRARLVGDGERPGLLIFSTCRDLIRTLPALQHDPAKAEDVDTEAEDHAADELRYACMSRPYVKEKPMLVRPKFPVGPVDGPMPSAYTAMTFNELRDANARRRAMEE